MALTGVRVSVTTTATLVVRGDSDGQFVNVRNSEAATAVVLGAAGVTATTGYTLPAATAVTLELGAGESLYGIVAAGTASVHVLSARS